jgi:hypothetical protein
MSANSELAETESALTIEISMFFKYLFLPTNLPTCGNGPRSNPDLPPSASKRSRQLRWNRSILLGAGISSPLNFGLRPLWLGTMCADRGCPLPGGEVVSVLLDPGRHAPPARAAWGPCIGNWQVHRVAYPSRAGYR